MELDASVTIEEEYSTQFLGLVFGRFWKKLAQIFWLLGSVKDEENDPVSQLTCSAFDSLA